MPSLFGGINIGLRTMTAHRIAIDIVNQNISNANTEGYSRRTADITPQGSTAMLSLNHSGPLLLNTTGVEVSGITRYRSAIVDTQYRQQYQSLSQWQVSYDTLREVEMAYNEPGDNGLSAAMSKFFTSWSDLATNPASDGARAEVRRAGQDVASTFNGLYTQLRTVQADLNRRVLPMVDEVNTIAKEIVDLNVQVVNASTAGLQANDQLDRRDQLITRLSELVGATAVTLPNGAVNVLVGSSSLVAGTRGDARDELVVTGDPANNSYNTITWKSSGLATSFGGGEMKAILDMRDTGIASHIDDLNTLASGLITQMNAVHAAGNGANGAGNAFFAGTGAADMALSAAVQSSDLNIAAAGATEVYPGGGSNARALSNMKDALTMPGAAASVLVSFGTYYSRLVSDLGADARHAKSTVENQTILVQNLKTQQESMAGVSLDEEAANLVKFQKIYDAAARIISIYDEMLNTIVNGMGAGR